MRLVIPPLLVLFLVFSPAFAEESGEMAMRLTRLQDEVDKLKTVVESQTKTISDQESHIGALMHYLPLAFGVERKMTLEDGNNFCVNRFFPTVINVEAVPNGSVVLCGFMAPPNQRSSE